jgi:hypothetical protein
MDSNSRYGTQEPYDSDKERKRNRGRSCLNIYRGLLAWHGASAPDGVEGAYGNWRAAARLGSRDSDALMSMK